LQKRERRQGPARAGKARQGKAARPPDRQFECGKKDETRLAFSHHSAGKFIDVTYFLEGYLFYFIFFSRQVFFWGSWFYAFLFL